MWDRRKKIIAGAGVGFAAFLIILIIIFSSKSRKEDDNKKPDNPKICKLAEAKPTLPDQTALLTTDDNFAAVKFSGYLSYGDKKYAQLELNNLTRGNGSDNILLTLYSLCGSVKLVLNTEDKSPKIGSIDINLDQKADGDISACSVKLSNNKEYKYIEYNDGYSCSKETVYSCKNEEKEIIKLVVIDFEFEINRQDKAEKDKFVSDDFVKCSADDKVTLEYTTKQPDYENRKNNDIVTSNDNLVAVQFAGHLALDSEKTLQYLPINKWDKIELKKTGDITSIKFEKTDITMDMKLGRAKNSNGANVIKSLSLNYLTPSKNWRQCEAKKYPDTINMFEQGFECWNFFEYECFNKADKQVVSLVIAGFKLETGRNAHSPKDQFDSKTEFAECNKVLGESS